MMRKRRILLQYVVPLLLAGPVSADDCQDPGWLVGEWRAENGGTLFIETWRRAADGALEGEATSRSTTQDEVYVQETLRIEQRDGRLYYVATVPSNPGPVSFGLVSCDSDRLVFENAEHDFPNRISYQRSGADAFSAEVTNLEDQGFMLDFTRVR